MRALVLGGAGFVGVAACKELMRRGVETIAAGRSDQPYGTFTSFERVDRADTEALARLLAEREPDVVLDLARPSPADTEWLAANFHGRQVVLSCADRPALPAGGRRVVVRSGPVVGAGAGGAPLSDTPAAPELAGLVWVKDLGFALALAADLRRPVEGRLFDVGFPNGPNLDLEPAVASLGWRPSAPEECLAEILAYRRSRSGR